MPEQRTLPLKAALAKHPETKPRLARAFGALLGIGLAGIVVLGALVLWHLVRRGRLIREGLILQRRRD
jgi:hypothetical protein